MNRLRFLSFDDLFVLKSLYAGHSLTETARELSLTQPAITQRVRKMEDLFKFDIYKHTGRRIVLTKEGEALCQRALDALTLMEDLDPKKSDIVVRIGTRPEAGRSWLWPAICNLKSKHPHVTYHVSYGSGSEILALLGVDRLDCVLTSAPLTSKSFSAIDLDREDYDLVAAPAIAKTIKKPADLNNQTLIEHDRSFPLTRYISSGDKVKITYRDVWFLESTEIMAAAIAEGHGVGVLPRYIAQRYYKTKKLMPLKIGIKIDHDFFRLIYRNDRNIDEPLTLIANELKHLGLR